jgi:DNA polymerase V
MFALVDVNSMYASCEKIFDPLARRTGVIVLSNNDGCVVAMCRLAKAKLGNVKFQPYFKIIKQVEASGVTVRSSNYELYADLSASIMDILSRYSPEQHIYSIDESFLRFQTQPKENWWLLGKEIRRVIWQEVRLPVCVGLGPTATLAKAGNYYAKRNRNTGGVSVVDKQNITTVLQGMAVEDVWGIGARLGKKLRLMSIDNAWKLSQQPAKLMRQQFSVNIERTVRELQGESCLTWDEVRSPKQQIFSTRAFGEKVSNYASLEQSLVMHAEKIAKKARKQGSLIKMIVAFAHSNPFADGQIYRRNIHHGFFDATADSRDLAFAASEAAKQIYRPGVLFHKSGVGAIELLDNTMYQQDMFSVQKRDPRVMDVLDTINQRFGPNSMSVAAKGIQGKWQMRREMKSPNYTSSWLDMVKINCDSVVTK